MRATPLLLVLCAALPSAPVLAQTSDFSDGLNAIQQKSIEADLRELSQDSYMGRNCPTPGYMRAAAFMEARFQALGLEPGGTDPKGAHPYFRYWSKEATVPTADCELSFDDGQDIREFKLEQDWIPLAGSEETSLEGNLVFVGYAINASKWRYKDTSGVKLKNKVAIAFWHEPRENQKGQRFDGPDWTKHSSAIEKAKLVQDKGASALILIQDPLHEPADRPPLFQFPRFSGRNGRPREKLLEFPIVFVSLKVGEILTGMDLRAEHAKIDKSLKCKARDLPGRRVKIEVSFERKPVEVPNVVGVVPGTEDREHSTVLAAHLDHIGADDGGRIWNGADDNASGSSALLALAAAFMAAPPRRDTILISMAAEEWGLLGSEAYAKKPLMPLLRTDFMMNIDMVGRGDTKEIAVMGAWDSKPLKKIIKTSAKRVGARLKINTDGGRQYWHRSDQLNFFKHGVPSLFISEVGIEHVDYHQPSDTMDKIDSKKAMYAAKLAFAISWNIANREDPLKRIPIRRR